MSSTKELLRVNNLKTYFFLKSGVAKAVDGVSFSVGKGEALGIVGESGSGKSVTASSVIRLLPNKVGQIVSGEITFDGRDVLALTNKELLTFRGKEVAMVFQDPMTSLDPVFTVEQQMVETIRTHQPELDYKQARQLAIDALRDVGIPNPERRIRSYPYELSGGMCQRVIIAIAICCQAKMIIADEPTTALDVTVQSQVLKLLKKQQQERDMAILLITHNLGVVWEMCDHVAVMYAGKIVEYTSARQLYSQPLHPYTWGLLDSAPKLTDQRKERLVAIEGMPPDLRLTGDYCSFCDRCAYAEDICRQQAPPLVEVASGHQVACHLQQNAMRLQRGRA